MHQDPNAPPGDATQPGTTPDDADGPSLDLRLRDSFARQTMMATFGASMDSVAPGRVVLSAPILPGSRQQHGAGHAALTFGLGDSAAGYAALSLLSPGSEVMTVEMKINLLSPARGARLIAVGEVARAGRRLIVVRAEVFAQATAGDSAADWRSIALLQGTMIPVDP